MERYPELTVSGQRGRVNDIFQRVGAHSSPSAGAAANWNPAAGNSPEAALTVSGQTTREAYRIDADDVRRLADVINEEVERKMRRERELRGIFR